MLFNIPIPLLLMALFGITAVIGIILGKFTRRYALSQGLLFGSVVGFLGIGLSY